MLNKAQLTDLFDHLGTPLPGRKLVQEARIHAPVRDVASREAMSLPMWQAGRWRAKSPRRATASSSPPLSGSNTTNMCWSFIRSRASYSSPWSTTPPVKSVRYITRRTFSSFPRTASRSRNASLRQS